MVFISSLRDFVQLQEKWNTFHSVLTTKGFFKGADTPEAHQERLQKAKKTFLAKYQQQAQAKVPTTEKPSQEQIQEAEKLKQQGTAP